MINESKEIKVLTSVIVKEHVITKNTFFLLIKTNISILFLFSSRKILTNEMSNVVKPEINESSSDFCFSCLKEKMVLK